ncbi:MAG TPA: glycosyltransferase [Solirubrobacteraceae bacterium]|nr:glycosyltransferase [Solirubrobacteraceae bacterium]
MRALVISNMRPDAANPGRGSFVRDQVAALRRIDGLEVELCEFGQGPRALARVAFELRRRHGPPSTLTRRPASVPYDVVHAHFGLAAWPALAVPARVRAVTVHGTDVAHPRSRLATAPVLGLMQIVAAVSAALVEELPGRRARSRAIVLPCGVDTARFVPMPRAQARAALGLSESDRYVLFPADPARPEKRHDHALALARAAGVELLALGHVAPRDVPLWVNAADAVVVPSDREGFGLAVLEALACDVPVLATPVGIHAEALAGIPGTLSAPFSLETWGVALAATLASEDPRVRGRSRATEHSTDVMAARVHAAWEQALRQRPHGGG